MLECFLRFLQEGLKMQLFTAGPAQTPQSILDALASPTLHHRSPSFLSLLEQCKIGLQNFVQMPWIFFLCSSGSGGMESAISSFSPKKILILNHGKFSSRWLEIANHLQIPSYNFQIPSGQSHSESDILKILQEDPDIDCLCMQTCESSSGAQQNFQSIAQCVKAHNAHILICVDGIASFGIEPIDTSNMDVFIASSQKALMLPVGLAFVFLSSFAYELLQTRIPLCYYLALQNYLTEEIPFSFPSNLLFALQASLDGIKRPKKNYDLVTERFELVCDFFKAYGIELFAKQPSQGIIAFKDENENIKTKLEKFNILISGGQGELKNHISRIGNFGMLQDFNPLLDALKKITP